MRAYNQLFNESKWNVYQGAGSREGKGFDGTVNQIYRQSIFVVMPVDVLLSAMLLNAVLLLKYTLLSLS